jgi:hypothetical protein
MSGPVAYQGVGKLRTGGPYFQPAHPPNPTFKKCVARTSPSNDEGLTLRSSLEKIHGW